LSSDLFDGDLFDVDLFEGSFGFELDEEELDLGCVFGGGLPASTGTQMPASKTSITTTDGQRAIDLLAEITRL